MSSIEARVAQQAELEHLFNKNQLMDRVRHEIVSEEDGIILRMLEEAGIDVKFGVELLLQMSLHKRCSVETLAGTLRRHFTEVQQVLDEITKCIEADFADYDVISNMVIVKFTLSADVQGEIDMYQFPLPMVVEPKELQSNKDTGYLTPVAGHGSVILKNNHTDDDVCLDHLNRMNRQKLSLNMHVAKMIKNKWRHLDKPKPGEPLGEFQKRKKAFEKYDATASDAMAIITGHTDHFFITHKYDKRGRTYCQGYHINPQGAAWNKAVIEFHEGEYLE